MTVAGKNAVDELRKCIDGQICDRSGLYADYKDLNDFLSAMQHKTGL